MAMTVSLALRRHTSRASSTATVAVTSTLPREATRLAENSWETSVLPSTVTISAGLAT